MAKYYIDYGTGAGNEWVEGSLEEAMEQADKGAAYTQTSYGIQDENGEEIASRRWWGVAFDPKATEETEDEIIDFGKFGYYGAWQVW